MKQKRYVMILTLIIILQIICIIYWGNRKEGYHIDEIFSYGLSNSYYAPFMDSNGDYWYEWHDSDYLLRYVAASEEHTFAYDSVYYNQTQDVHPFLYYFILHTVCSFFPGVFSKWFAIGINGVFAILTLIVLYNLSKRLLKGGRAEALVLCAAYAVSAGTISHVVFLRMYVMLAFFTMLYVYLNILLYEGKKMYFPLMLCIIMGGLTHYYFYVFAFFVSAFYCIYKLIYKEYKQLIVYMISAFASIGINLLIYPSTLTHIFSGYRGQEAFENIQSESFVEKVSQYIPYINMELFGGLSKYIVLVVGILIVIIFVIRCVRINKSVDGEIVVHTSLNSDKVVTWKMYATMSLFISIVAYLILIPTISSVINTRYIFCIYPFILLFWFIILGFLTELIWINGKKYLLIMVCISCIITYSEYKRGYVDFLYQGYEDMADTISEYSDLDVLYVEEYLFPIYRDMMFLDRSERFIPIEYDKFEESLNNIYTEKNEDGVIVYVFRDLDEQKVFDVLEKEWGYTEFTHLALTYQSNVYLCR